jgi:hypothetical protein
MSDDLHYGYEQLTANEIDADPSLARHDGEPLRKRNRSGQKAGISKTHFDETYVRRKYAMLASPAYMALSLSAHRVMARLEIEFGRHKGKPEENGALPCTFEDFADYGVNRAAIAPALRELVALGFIRVTRKGSAGNERHRQPALYLLTYQHHGSHAMLEDGWKRIQTIEEAEAIAENARKAKGDPRAVDFGRRGAKARWAKKQSPGDGFHTEPSMVSIPSPGDGFHTDRPDFPVMDSIPLSRVSHGARGEAAPAHTTTIWTKPTIRQLACGIQKPDGRMLWTIAA